MYGNGKVMATVVDCRSIAYCLEIDYMLSAKAQTVLDCDRG